MPRLSLGAAGMVAHCGCAVERYGLFMGEDLSKLDVLVDAYLDAHPKGRLEPGRRVGERQAITPDVPEDGVLVPSGPVVVTARKRTGPSKETLDASRAAAKLSARKRREMFVELLAANPDATNEDILRCIPGVGNIGSYYRWRQSVPRFADEVDRIREGGLIAADPKTIGSYVNNFPAFRKNFFGFDTYYHQRRIVDAIENSPRGRITMVLCPPEHGKTTVLEDYMCFKLALDPNFRITYVHESNNFAKRVLRRVSHRMVDVDGFGKYIGMFGPFYKEGQEKLGKPWTAEHLTVVKAEHDERDYSLQVRGWTSSVQGTRTDLLLVDDVQALKSLNQTERIAETLRQDFFSRPGKEGKIVMVGTRVGMNDVYEFFLNDPGLGDLIDLVQMPAMSPEDEPLCPEMWSAEDLALKRKVVGEEAWWRNYQQSPLSSGSQTFNSELVDACKSEEAVVCVKPPDTTVVLGVDPALGGGNAVFAGAYTRDTFQIVDVRLDYGLGQTEQILDAIQDFAVRYNPLDVVIETAALQRGIARDERLQSMARLYGFRIKEHETAGRKSDPIMGVASMASSFIRQEIIIPWGTQLAEARLTPLLAELISWRPDIATRHLKQDTVMAMWFAWRHWMEARQQIGFDMSQWDFAGLPWRR